VSGIEYLRKASMRHILNRGKRVQKTHGLYKLQYINTAGKISSISVLSHNVTLARSIVRALPDCNKILPYASKLK
jgi:hypothetical protein